MASKFRFQQSLSTQPPLKAVYSPNNYCRHAGIGLHRLIQKSD